MMLLLALNGLFSERNFNLHVENIDSFEVDPPLDFQSSFLCIPWNFPIFCIDPLEPGKLRFFLNFWQTPWNSNNFYSTPWNYLICSTGGGGIKFFLGKPNFLVDYEHYHPGIS